MPNSVSKVKKIKSHTSCKTIVNKNVLISIFKKYTKTWFNNINTFKKKIQKKTNPASKYLKKYDRISRIKSVIVHIIFILMLSQGSQKELRLEESKFSVISVGLLPIDLVSEIAPNSLSEVASIEAVSETLIQEPETKSEKQESDLEQDILNQESFDSSTETNIKKEKASKTITISQEDSFRKKKILLSPKKKPDTKKQTTKNDQKEFEDYDEISEVLRNMEGKNRPKDTARNIIENKGDIAARGPDMGIERSTSISMTDMLHSRLVKCWKIPTGIDKESIKLEVTLSIKLNKNGQLLEIVPMNQIRYKNDKAFAVITDSAIRALNQCSPFSELLNEPHETWSQMFITFDPKINS